MKKVNSERQMLAKLRKCVTLAICLLIQACQTINQRQDIHCEASDCRPCDNACLANASEGKTPPKANQAKTASAEEVAYSKTSEAEDQILYCANAKQFANEIVGDGHCVSLIRACSNAPNTSQWKPGDFVSQTSPKRGTVIATFLDEKYPNRTGYHAAIYISQNQDGIWVWDQWLGQAVKKRLIRFTTKPTQAANSAQAYRIATIDAQKADNQ